MSDFATNRMSLLFNYDGLTMYIHFWLHIRLTISNSKNIKKNLIITHSTFGAVDGFVNLYIIILVIVLASIGYELGNDQDQVYRSTLLVISVFEFYISIVFIVSGAVLITRMKKWSVSFANIKEELAWFITASVVSSLCSFIRGLLLSYEYMFNFQAGSWTYPWLFYVVPDCLVTLVLTIDMGRVKRWRIRKKEQILVGELEHSSIEL